MTKITISNNLIIKNILLAIALTLCSFVLLNLTFIFDALFQGLIDIVLKLFTPVDLNTTYYWFSEAKHAAFIVIIGLISWLIFRSKIGLFYQATYTTVPLAVIFATVGIFLYRWPTIIYLIGGLFSMGVLYFFYRTKKHWLYWYALILIGLLMLIVNLSGTEI